MPTDSGPTGQFRLGGHGESAIDDAPRRPGPALALAAALIRSSRPFRVGRALCILALGTLALVAAIAPGAAGPADTVTVVGAVHADYGRVAFRWPATFGYGVDQDGARVVVHFDRPLDGRLDRLPRQLSGYVQSARLSQDGKAVELELTRPFRLRSFKDGPKVVAIDFLGKPGAAEAGADDQPPPAAHAAVPARDQADRLAGPRVVAHAGAHKGYDRLVFDWPRRIGYQVTRDGDNATISFDQPGRIDLSRIKANDLHFADMIDERTRPSGVSVIVTVKPGVGLRDRRDGSHIVLDLLAPTPESLAAAKAEAKAKAKAEAKTKATPAAAPTPLTPALAAKAAPGAASAAATPSTVGPAPAAKPKDSAAADTLVVGYSADASGATLQFPWTDITKLAAFRRADTLWLVFDATIKLDLSHLPPAGDDKNFTKAERLDSLRGTVLRLTVPTGVVAAPQRNDFVWTVRLARGPERPQVPIAILPQPNSPIGPRVDLPIESPGFPIAIVDPEVGDRLYIVPVQQSGWGVFQDRSYVDFKLIASDQGIVVEPHIDGIRVTARGDGVDIMAASGELVLSNAPEPATAGMAFGNAKTTPALFDLAAWRGEPAGRAIDRKQMLQLKLAQAPADQREQARLALARFYFAEAMPTEALGLLDLMAQDHSPLLEQPDVKAMAGAIHALKRDFATAAKLLSDPRLAAAPEAALWRGAIDAERRDYAAAEREFLFGGALIGHYPHELRVQLGLLAAETLLARGDRDRAGALIRDFEKEELSTAERGRIALLHGREMELNNRPLDALPYYEEAERSGDELGAAEATLARTDLLVRLGKLDRKQAIKQLDALRFAWRGDSFELDLLDKLGRLYLDDGQYREGLATLKRAVAYFPDDPRAKQMAALVKQIFDSLWLKGGIAKVSPLVAVAIYREFKDLVPAGPAGDEVRLALVDRLVAIDLLDQAGSVLDAMIKTRLEGARKADIGLRLAKLRLLDNKPDQALAALAESAVDGIPAPLAEARRLTEARALEAAHRDKDALAKLDGDTGAAADEIRADIAWKAQSWPIAAQVYGRLAQGLPAGAKPLDAAGANVVLRCAIALTMAGDHAGVAKLRSQFAAAMPAGSMHDAFLVVTTDLPPGSTNKLADAIAEVDNFKAFLASYRKEFLDRAKVAEASQPAG